MTRIVSKRVCYLVPGVLSRCPGKGKKVTGLDLHFLPLGENKGSAPSSRRRQCSSALHLDGFESDRYKE